jgi:hypothetical protein
MSLLPLTPTIIQVMRTDFRQGTWSPTTQAFFQQLFDRVGGPIALTNLELAGLFATLEGFAATNAAHFALIDTAIAALQALESGSAGHSRYVAPLAVLRLLDTQSLVVARYMHIAGTLSLEGDAALEVV